MKETRIVVQEKDENGNWNEIGNSSNFVGVIYGNSKDDMQATSVIISSPQRMMHASGLILGYSNGLQDEISKLNHSLSTSVEGGDNHA